ncbi:MAG: ribonuclease H family protein [Muribaculaceae bacterium]|nr:ribonuclease H family protein [Muribaculaceae bacterium]
MKYYTVFKGFSPGVYEDWDEVQLQIHGFPGALFKSFSTKEAAVEAYRNFTGTEDREELARLITSANRPVTPPPMDSSRSNPEVDWDAWAVDASCLGNPGIMEYRGVNLKTGEEIFRVGPFEDATNNIGEFLALVHAMALMAKTGDYHNIYSDSRTAMSWWRNRKVKTTLQPTPRNEKVFELLARASAWINVHQFPMKVSKWQTERWGEIPADFGRK